MLGGHLDRLVHITALDQAEPAHLLLGLGERPVGEQQLAAAYPDGLALGGRPQPAAALQHAPFGHPLAPPEAALVRVGRGALVPPDQQQVSHHSSLPNRYDNLPGHQSPLTEPYCLQPAARSALESRACPLPVTRSRTWRGYPGSRSATPNSTIWRPSWIRSSRPSRRSRRSPPRASRRRRTRPA